MIYLLDGTGFKLELNWSGKTKYMSADFNLSNLIADKLKLASESEELIHTQWLRGIDKTYGSIQYARRNNLAVLEPHKMTAKEIREREDYEKVYHNNVDYLRGLNIKYVVIDEGVTNIQEIKDAGITVFTGFYTPKKESELSFDDKVIKTLMNEIEALTPKLQQTRENRDYGTYKNLINAYREVLYLIQSLMKSTVTK